MSQSSLVDYTKISPYHTHPRQDAIKKITIHHMAGKLSVYECGEVFQRRKASAHYGIDAEGRIGQYVLEEDRSWSTGSGENDHQAINIELANKLGDPDWPVADITIDRCVELCVDICRRNGISSIKYTGDATGNLTLHKWFMTTLCPGPYLEARMQHIADRINEALKEAPTPALPPAPTPALTRYDIDAHMQLCQYGDTGLHVKIWQTIIGVEPDGSFGPKTWDATLEWQRNHGLEADGSVGPLTWQTAFDNI